MPEWISGLQLWMQRSNPASFFYTIYTPSISVFGHKSVAFADLEGVMFLYSRTKVCLKPFGISSKRIWIRSSSFDL